MACFFPLISDTSRVVNVLEKRLYTFPLSQLLYTDTIVSGSYIGAIASGFLRVFSLSKGTVVLNVSVHPKESNVAGMWGENRAVVWENSGRVRVYELSQRAKVVADITEKAYEIGIVGIRGHNGHVVLLGRQPVLLRNGKENFYRLGEGKTVIGVGHNWYATGSTSFVVIHTPEGDIETRFSGDFQVVPLWVDYCNGGAIGVFFPTLLGVNKSAVIVWNEKKIIGLVPDMDMPQVVAGDGRFYALSPSALVEWDANGLVEAVSLPSLKSKSKTALSYQQAHEMLTGKGMHVSLLSTPSALLFALSDNPAVKNWLSVTCGNKNIEMYVNGQKITP